MRFMCGTPAGTFGAILGMGLHFSDVTTREIDAPKCGLGPCLIHKLTRPV